MRVVLFALAVVVSTYAAAAAASAATTAPAPTTALLPTSTPSTMPYMTTAPSSSIPSYTSGGKNDGMPIYYCGLWYTPGNKYYYDISQLRLGNLGYVIDDKPISSSHPDYLFEFNICGKVSCPDPLDPKISDAAACQSWHGNDKDQRRILGRLSEVTISEHPNGPNDGVTLTYGGGDVCKNHGNINRTTTIYITCSPKNKKKPEVVFLGETSTCNYEFTLLAYDGACPMKPGKNKPAGLPPAVRALSAGSDILIVFTILFFVYLLFGAAYKRVVIGATGIEMIPNIAFWRDLPSLVSEGISYTFSCGTGPSSATYDQL